MIVLAGASTGERVSRRATDNFYFNQNESATADHQGQLALATNLSIQSGRNRGEVDCALCGDSKDVVAERLGAQEFRRNSELLQDEIRANVRTARWTTNAKYTNLNDNKVVDVVGGTAGSSLEVDAIPCGVTLYRNFVSVGADWGMCSTYQG